MALSCILLFSTGLEAQNKSAPLLKVDQQLQKDKEETKFDSHLQRVQTAVTKSRNKDSQQLKEVLEKPIYVIQDETILVELIAKKNPSKLAAAAAAIGFEKTASFGKTVSGRINVNLLKELGKLSTLR